METPHRYRSARKRLTVFTVAAWILVGTAGLSLALDNLAESMYPTWNDMEAELSSGEWTLVLIGLALLVLNVGANLTCIVSFCMWAHRSNCNARARGATNLRFSPAGTFGWFFVPIMNLFRPYQAIAEIDRVSTPAGEANSGGNAPAILGFWWAAWLISTFLGRIAFRMDMRELTGRPISEEIQDALDIANLTFVVVSSVLAVAVMRRIVENQDQRSVPEVFE